jgi:hypothetical protein
MLPLFILPFWHLHRLMKERRDEYLFDLPNLVEELLASIRMLKENDDAADVQKRLSSIDYVEKYRKMVMGFPVWPLPLPLSMPPIGSIIVAALPLLQKGLAFALSRGGLMQ